MKATAMRIAKSPRSAHAGRTSERLLATNRYGGPQHRDYVRGKAFSKGHPEERRPDHTRTEQRAARHSLSIAVAPDSDSARPSGRLPRLRRHADYRPAAGDRGRSRSTVD